MKYLLRVAVGFTASLGLLGAQPQQAPPPPNPSSLGDLARQLKAERAKAVKQPAKVYTTDDFSFSAPDSGSSADATGAKSSDQPSASGGGGTGLDEKYYRKAIGEARAKLETHKRELEVLQQKLAQNNIQYYSDPNKTLTQELTRGDVNKLSQDIEAKKQEIESDQKAIDDSENQYRRRGGSPGTLREIQNSPVPSTRETNTAESASSSPSEGDTKGEDKKKTPEYWQAQFKGARGRVARAEEEQKLVEDELSLLEIQQARELAADVQAEVSQKIAAKKAELEASRASVAKARKALEALEAAFKNSGAPEDWRPRND